MKFRIVGTLLFLVLLGVAYLISQDNSGPPSKPSNDGGGYVIH